MRTNRFVRRKRRLKDLPDIEDWPPYAAWCRQQLAAYDACSPQVRKALRNAVANIDGPQTRMGERFYGANHIVEGIETNNEAFTTDDGVPPIVNEE